MFKKILIPVDIAHKEQAERLINVAVLLGGAQPIEINLLYVDQSLVHQGSYPHLDNDIYASHRDAAEQQMQELLNSYLPDSATGLCHSRKGTAHDQILEAATSLSVDAIVMMARKPGISSYFIGSNAERVVRHGECSVFVIRD